MQKELVIAYIGFGNSVIRYHLPYLRKRKHIHVKSIYRREEDRIGDKERESLYPAIHFTSNLEELLQDDEIQVICINSPNETHTFYAEKALRAGKHILVEKPFALHSEDAKRIFDLAKELNKVAYTNQNRRFDTDFLSLKKALEGNQLGDLIELESHYDYFKTRPVVCEHMVFNLGIHTIDQMVSLFGIPKKVHYDVRGILIEDGDDYFDIELYYEKFKVSVKTSLFVCHSYPRFLAHGNRGSFWKYSQGHLYTKHQQEPLDVAYTIEDKSNWGTISYIKDTLDMVEQIPSEASDYGRIYDDLYECIYHHKEPYVKPEEVIAVLDIAENAILKS